MSLLHHVETVCPTGPNCASKAHSSCVEWETGDIPEHVSWWCCNQLAECSPEGGVMVSRNIRDVGRVHHPQDGLGPNSGKIQAHLRSGIPTIWDVNRSCSAETVTNLARTNSSCPSGVPNIVTSLSLGREGGVTTPDHRVRIRPANCCCQCTCSCRDSTSAVPQLRLDVVMPTVANGSWMVVNTSAVRPGEHTA